MCRRHCRTHLQHHLDYFIRRNYTAYPGQSHIRRRQCGYGTKSVADDTRDFYQAGDRIANESKRIFQG
ncbi:hypothetical protein D3C81_2008300 [compost metagenome]